MSKDPKVVRYILEVEGLYSSVNARLRSLNETMDSFGVKLGMDGRVVLFLCVVIASDFIGEEKIEEVKKIVLDSLNDSAPTMNPTISKVTWERVPVSEVTITPESEAGLVEVLKKLEGTPEILHTNLQATNVKVNFDEY